MDYRSFSDAQKRAYFDQWLVLVGIALAYICLMVYSASELNRLIPYHVSAPAVVALFYITMVKWYETATEVMEAVEIMSKIKG